MRTRMCLAIFWMLLLIKSTLAQPYLIQKLDSASSVDWGRLVIRATGNSATAAVDRHQRAEALERARIAAEEALLRALRQLQLHASARISDAIENGALLSAKRIAIRESELKSLAQTFTIIDTRSMSDMSVEVDVELPLTGELLNLVLPKKTGELDLQLNDTPLCPCCGQPWPEGRIVPEKIKLIMPEEGYTTERGTPFTGLIVDARTVALKAALMPRIVNESGDEIYGPGYVAREVAVEAGVVAYRKDLTTAVKDVRVGAAPLIVRAVNTAGAASTDIVVSNIDAKLIHAAAKSQNFLNQCKVIIVF